MNISVQVYFNEAPLPSHTVIKMYYAYYNNRSTQLDVQYNVQDNVNNVK